LWAKGWKYKNICETLLISESFVRNTVEKYKLFGVSSFKYSHYKGYNFKMTLDQEEKTVRYGENNFVSDSKMVIQWVKEEFGIEYTKQGMQKFLKRKSFVYKKPRTIPSKHPNEEAQKRY
jgi:transposase